MIVLAAFAGCLVYVFQWQAPALQKKEAGDKERLIGGDKDEGGCLIGAGYSWCEEKNKCLRTWEEPCIEENRQALVEEYLKENISALSPEKEVLGGKFYITRFRFTGDNTVTIDYEDGHIAFIADVSYDVQDGQVIVENFSISDDFGYKTDDAGSTSTAVAELTALFAEKHDVDPADITVTIRNIKNGYLRGGVKLSPDADAPGGYFLAKTVDGGYVIVVEGNGQIDCNLVSDFPAEMIDDCASRDEN